MDKEIESNLKLVKSSYEFCCNLQKDILDMKEIIITQEFKTEVQDKFKSFVTSVSSHIVYIIRFQLNCWHLSIKAINYLYGKILQNSNDKLIQNE